LGISGKPLCLISGQPHQKNIHQALAISGLKSRISITAGVRSASLWLWKSNPPGWGGEAQPAITKI
jgi:hypothetical protein